MGEDQSVISQQVSRSALGISESPPGPLPAEVAAVARWSGPAPWASPFQVTLSAMEGETPRAPTKPGPGVALTQALGAGPLLCVASRCRVDRVDPGGREKAGQQ